MSKFADAAVSLASKFDASLLFDGKAIDRNALLAHCEGLATELMNEWGEEPGSENLRVLIEQHYC